MRNIILAALVAAPLAILFGSDAEAGQKCGTKKTCVPPPVCKCITIADADFRACGRKWYASTSEGWKSPMFEARKGCVCTRQSNDWSYVGAATGRTYLWRIWVGH